MSDAEDDRFRAFLGITQQAERDRIAFGEFEEAVRRATEGAAKAGSFDDPARHLREIAVLETSVRQMLLRALPRFGVAPIRAKAEGIGHAIRFDLLDPATGLDGVNDAAALDAIVQKAAEALRAQLDETLERLWKERRRKERRQRGRP